jgi:hypothetical protein
MGARSGGGAGFAMNFKDINTGKSITKTSWAKSFEGAYKSAEKISDASDNLIIKSVGKNKSGGRKSSGSKKSGGRSKIMGSKAGAAVAKSGGYSVVNRILQGK